MNSIQIFNYNNSPISFKNENGQLMANATQMAKSFGKQPSDWIRLKTTSDFLDSLSSVRQIPRTELMNVEQGGATQGTWMHEDVAIEFSRWLSPSFAIWCNDRVKELMKHGATAINPADLLNPDFIINLATELKRERSEKERLQFTAAAQAKELISSAPKVEYYENVLQSESLIQANVIAKELGMSAVSLNKLLHDRGVIYKSGDSWVLYHQYQGRGWTGTKTHTYTNSLGHEKTSVQTYWTEKGREFIHGLFKMQKTA